MGNPFQISVILPAFNEENNLKFMAEKLSEILKDYDYTIVFVDDGSKDNSLEILKTLRAQNPRIQFLSFSRNFGHQIALKAGLDYAKGDCLIFMDCDLQHPPNMISDMIESWKNGYEVVFTIREDFNEIPFFKRTTAACFYRLLNFLSDVPITPGRADFFLIDHKVAEVLRTYEESPLFFRGILPRIGFKQIGIKYKPAQRFSGKSKYSLKKMIELAIDGITAFSIRPLRVSILFGIIVSALALVYFIFIIHQKFFTNHNHPGWTSLLASVLLLGGIQLISLGIMGEYLGKLFMDAKKRPKYILREQSGDHR